MEKVNEGAKPGTAPAEFMSVRAVAPFEIASIMEAWTEAAEAWLAGGEDFEPTADQQKVLDAAHWDAPWHDRDLEDLEAYGVRFAVALFALLKVV